MRVNEEDYDFSMPGQLKQYLLDSNEKEYWDCDWDNDIDVWYHDIVDCQKNVCEPEPMNSEDPLFILYTSGSTGQPKGVMHTTAGYLLGAHISFKYLFGFEPNDNYWCTADVGWITGHTYIIYGPLSNGATSLMFEGVPTYPDASRCWEVCDKHNINIDDINPI